MAYNSTTWADDSLTAATALTTTNEAVSVGGTLTVSGASTFSNTLTVGENDTGYDVKLFGATSGSYMLWDESADTLILTDSTPIKIGDGADLQLYHDGSNSYITNSTGALKLATESSGIAISIGHTTSETTVNDNLSVTGNIDVDGTSNLDAVDIDGAVQLDATLTIGVDDTGYDIKAFGATTGMSMLWDESADTLIVTGLAYATGKAGTSNTVFGKNAGLNLEAGSNYNVFVGENSGDGVCNDAVGNTAIGYNSLTGITQGDYNSCIGYGAGYALSTGTYNILIGGNAGDALTTANSNVAVGYNAGTALTVGASNVAIGNAALYTAVEDSGCVAIGLNALNVANGGGSDGSATLTHNVAVGYTAGAAVTTATGSTLIGANAGDAITNDVNNTCVGYNSFSSAGEDDGHSNTVIGSSAMASHNYAASDHNIAIGLSTLKGGTAGAISHNVAIGNYAVDHASATPTYGVYIGYASASDAAVTGASNIAIGASSCSALTSGAQNVVIGRLAGDAISTGSNHIAIGYQALSAEDTADTLIAIGTNALLLNDGGVSNIAIGHDAGEFLTDGDYNTFIGFRSGQGITGTKMQGDQNTCVGYYSGFLLQGTDADYNTLIGSQAGQAITSGDSNISIGRASCNALATGTNNVIIGNNAMQTANGSESQNTAVGHQALATMDADGNGLNTAVGYAAGDGITTGVQNTGLGASTAFDVDANNQTAVGYGATTDSANDIAIGNTSVDEVKGQVDFSTFSDERIKTNIQDNDLGLDFINLLKPRKFNKVNPAEYPDSIKKSNDGLCDWTDAQANKIWDGLVAQEVKSAIDACNSTFSGWGEESNSKQLVTYSTLVIPLIKAVQELSSQVEELKSKLGD